MNRDKVSSVIVALGGLWILLTAIVFSIWHPENFARVAIWTIVIGPGMIILGIGLYCESEGEKS
jgi:hypothetical protein